MRAIFLPTNGPAEVREIDTDLTTLQGLVGGYIEFVPVSTEVHLWVNEDGRAKALPVNREATAISGRHLVGDAVLVGNGIGDGNDGDVPGSWIDGVVGPE